MQMMAAAKQMVEAFDKDGSGSMSLPEFLTMVMKAEGIGAE
jgi:Ca2+-binding EF-hand superfamily protein